MIIQPPITHLPTYEPPPMITHPRVSRESKGKERIDEPSSSVDIPQLRTYDTQTSSLPSSPQMLSEYRHSKDTQTNMYNDTAPPYFMFLDKNKQPQQFLKPITREKLDELRNLAITERKKSKILSSTRFDRKKDLF